MNHMTTKRSGNAPAGGLHQRVLILGGGFGGAYAARHLDRTLGKRSDIEVVLISRENYLLFTPVRGGGGSVYLAKLPGIAKKVRVAIQWTLDLVFSRQVEQFLTRKDLDQIEQLAAQVNAGPLSTSQQLQACKPCPQTYAGAKN